MPERLVGLVNFAFATILIENSLCGLLCEVMLMFAF